MLSVAHKASSVRGARMNLKSKNFVQNLIRPAVAAAHDRIYRTQDTTLHFSPLHSRTSPATLFHFNFSMTMLHKFAQLRKSFATKKKK